MDDKPITIWMVLKELAAVLLMLGCFYLFLIGVSGYFDRPDTVKRKPVEILTSQGRDHTSGYGYYLRRAERGR